MKVVIIAFQRDQLRLDEWNRNGRFFCVINRNYLDKTPFFHLSFLFAISSGLSQATHRGIYQTSFYLSRTESFFLSQSPDPKEKIRKNKWPSAAGPYRYNSGWTRKLVTLSLVRPVSINFLQYFEKGFCFLCKGSELQFLSISTKT